MPVTERFEYAGLRGAGPPETRECFGPASDKPTRSGKGKVYFTYGQNGPHGTPYQIVECDLSPGAKLVQIAPGTRQLTEGHLRLMCPMCAEEGRARSLHIEAANKRVYVHEAEGQLLHYVPPSDATEHYFLPTFSVAEPVACDYREPSAGGCTWRALIREGRAYLAGGTMLFAR